MAQPPNFSKTKDNFSHHSSPAGMKQTPMPIPVPPKKAVPRTLTGTINNRSMPDHVTKHPNPVGRPATLSDSDRDEGGGKIKAAKDTDKDGY
jgi:hypothetical protein